MTLEEINRERIKILRQYSKGEIDGKTARKRIAWVKSATYEAARELARVRYKG